MKNTNIGIANLVISNKLKESYFNDNLLEESKKLTTDFFSTVKSSPILQLEFKVFSNIENKHIDNELVATRYIDNNIKLFEVYTINEIDKEREKLYPFLTEEIQNNSERIALYEAIDTLITESLNDYDKIDVDAVHEAFTLVLNYIKEPKKKLVEVVEDVQSINENVIEHKKIITENNEINNNLNSNAQSMINEIDELLKNGESINALEDLSEAEDVNLEDIEGIDVTE